MRYSIIFDGPNFIANAIDTIGDMDYFSDRFSLGGFCNKLVQGRLHHIFHAEAKSLGIEFFYSGESLGSGEQKLTNKQSDKLLERFSNEQAVYLNKVSIASSNEKGVNIAVAVRMIEMSNMCDTVCLVSSDKDYLPVFEYIKSKGKYAVTIGIDKKHPTELKNLSYLFVDMTNFLTYFIKR